MPKKSRCDKITDCLFGDDELGCEEDTFNEIFKYIMHSSQTQNESTEISVPHPVDNTHAEKPSTASRFMCKKYVYFIYLCVNIYII